MKNFPKAIWIRSRQFCLIAGLICLPQVAGSEEGAATLPADVPPTVTSNWLGDLIRGYRENAAQRHAQILLATGDRDRAVAAIAEMIRRHQELEGGLARIRKSQRQLAPWQLLYGVRQTRRMLADRPNMAGCLAPGDELFDWAARKFAGEDVPTRIDWQGDSTEQDFDALHHVPYDGSRGAIFVRATHGPHSNKPPGSEKTFDELWAEAAYELHNIQSYQGFGQLHERALEGKLTREEYIRQSARLEYDALLRTRAFYVEVYYPWARRHQVATDPENWRLIMPSAFEEWLAQYPADSMYPWQVYGGYYDELSKWRGMKERYDRAQEKLELETKKREQLAELWNKLAAGRRHEHLLAC